MVKGLLIGLCVIASGCADPGGTVVAMTLVTNVEDPGEGFHYELFSVLPAADDGPEGRVVSLMVFDLRAVDDPINGNLKEVYNPREPDARLGVVDGLDKFLRPIGGIRVRVPIDLTAATTLFITRESDGDTDPAPTQDVIMSCQLRSRTRGTLSCAMTDDEKGVLLGTASLVLPDVRGPVQ